MTERTDKRMKRRTFVATLGAGAVSPLLLPLGRAEAATAAIGQRAADGVVVNVEDFSGQPSEWSWRTPGSDQPFSAWDRAVDRVGLSPTTGPNGGADPVTRAVVDGRAYAYTEASVPENSVWTIESPEFDAAQGTLTLTFDLHMRFGRTGGQTDGTLVVQGWNGSRWSKIDQAIIGSKHTSATAPYLASTEFGTYTSADYRNSDFKFRLLFAEGSGGGTFPYDCALGNLRITRQANSRPRPTGIIQSFRGEDGVDNFPGALNFPVPERAHNRQDITGPPALVPFGTASMKVEIRPGDPQWDNDARIRPRSAKRRAEFSWRPFRFPGRKEGWVGAAFHLPSEPMADIKGCTIFQLHNSPDPGEMMQLYCFDGRLRADNENPSGTVRILDTELRPLLDRWVRLVINFKPSTGRDGFFKLWLDDVPVVDITGPNKPRGTLGPYLKHGTYFWGYEKFDRDRRAACYYDELKIGDETSSYSSVNPGS